MDHPYEGSVFFNNTICFILKTSYSTFKILPVNLFYNSYFFNEDLSGNRKAFKLIELHIWQQIRE